MLMSLLDYDDLPATQRVDEMEPGAYHAPVMPDEVAAFLRPGPGMLILDGTAGGGGHSEIFLRAGAEVVALDQDAEAIEHCGLRLSEFGSRLHLWQSNFARSGEVLDLLGLGPLQGAFLDLGVSSRQLDAGERGFSFLRDGPLDMRMDRCGSMTAAVLVNTADTAELARIFREYGEEPRAAQVAAHLARCRAEQPFRTTGELAAAVSEVIFRTGSRHPATKVFQALRIAVNDELGALQRGLEVITERLASGGRLGVLTFHSLEDRIVKHFFRDRSVEWIDRPEWPAPRKNPARAFRLLTPRPIDASGAEIQTNPRARSAKLRVVEKL
ncbi:MAG: 16S rRNA (cytosine(1402)-N(4))-methyltransferase RsmH [Terrimicrobiaceae bacterium]